MGSSQRGKLELEMSRTLVDWTLMTDSGDHQTFTAGTLMSGREGFEPDVRPNGIVTGGGDKLTPHSSNDTVAVPAFTAFSKGEEHSVSAASQAVTRPSVSTHKISAIIMDDEGALDEVEGTEGTSFSEEWGAAGGPPLLPVDAVLRGLVYMSAQASAVLTADEIRENPGQHAEYADTPEAIANNLGKGSYAEASAEKNAFVKFSSALPLNHTGSVPKRVYIRYYTPVLSVLQRVHDFKPAGMGVSKSSTPVYEGSGVPGAIGSMKADTVGDATFTLYVHDGITDRAVREELKTVTAKWYPDANKLPYLLTQGMLELDRDYPSKDPNKIACTIRCESPSVSFAS
jgi:hypothetical protein